MAKVIIESCDVCSKQKVNNYNVHWSTWGENIVMGFKNHPSIQSDIKFELLCSECAKKIQTAVFKTMNDISLETSKKSSDFSQGV